MSEDDAGPRTLEPTELPGGRAGRGVGRAFWSKAVPAFAVAALVLGLLPLDGAGDAPPIRVLLLAGLGVAVVMTAAVWLAVRFDLGLGVQVAAYAAAFNVLVILTKLVLGPYALYEVNQTVTMSDMLPLSDPVGAAGAAALVFALYALVLWLLFLVTRRRLRRHLGIRRERRDVPERVRRWWPVLLLLAPVIAGGSAIPVIAGLVLVSSGFEYVGFVLSSAVSLVVAVTLAGALLLAGKAFSTAEQRAVALGDAAVLTSLFWVCLAFLALYQVLWVVFVLALTSVWPLKVVTPK